MIDMTVDTGAEWILKTMVAMAAVDGAPDLQEVGLIRQIYRNQTGRVVDSEEVRSLAQEAVRNRDFLAELTSAAKTLDMHTKEEIVRAAYLVLLADGQIRAAERKTLQDIAHALRIPEIHFGAILEDLAIWMAAQQG